MIFLPVMTSHQSRHTLFTVISVVTSGCGNNRRSRLTLNILTATFSRIGSRTSYVDHMSLKQIQQLFYDMIFLKLEIQKTAIIICLFLSIVYMVMNITVAYNCITLVYGSLHSNTIHNVHFIELMLNALSLSCVPVLMMTSYICDHVDFSVSDNCQSSTLIQ